MKETCGTCGYWDAPYTDVFGGRYGNCNRYPPVHITMKKPLRAGRDEKFNVTQPTVGNGNWCGEWKEK